MTEELTSGVPDERARYIDGLRVLAAALEAHPDIPLPKTGVAGSPIALHFFSGPDPRADMAVAARALPCAWRKEFSDPDPEGRWPAYLDLHGVIGGLHILLTAKRDDVCRRVVVGTEEREVEEVVKPAKTRMVTKTVDVVEYDCGSLLAPAPGRLGAAKAAAVSA